MRMKAAFIVGGAIGYVMGTRAGRQQFEQIRSQAQKVWENPKVQERVSGAEQAATGFLKEKAPELKNKITGGRSGGGSESSGSGSASGTSSSAPDDLETFTTAGSDETERGTTGTTGGTTI